MFPVHPRTKQNLIKYSIQLPSNVLPIDAVGYIDFLSLLKNCQLALTDSGGVQEESIILRKPCITLRHTSARWETILLKANILFPPDNQDTRIILQATAPLIPRNRTIKGPDLNSLFVLILLMFNPRILINVSDN